MNSAKAIAEKILNCKTYDIPDIQELASAYLELEKEKARLILHIDDIEKANDNCQTKIANLELEITKLRKSREVLRKACEFYKMNKHWNIVPMLGERVLDKGYTAREAIKADDEIMKG